ncbi:glycosyltransferase family 2 protein [Monashia sp. NPDC004114]
MSHTEAVSVVVPHYGDPTHALALVSQLAAQRDVADLEVVVVDDASPTPYPDDERVVLVRRGANGGFGAAVNAGAAAARHPLLLILNSDVSIQPTFVADLCRAALAWQPAVVGPALVGLGGQTQWAGRHDPTTGHQVVEWLTPLARFRSARLMHEAVGHDTRCVVGAVRPVDWLVGAALLLPTAAFLDIGGFDEGFHMNCEEVDLQRRLRRHGIPSVFVGTVTATHAGGGSSGDDHRRPWLVASRLRYAQKWHEHPRRLRASLTAASLVNAVVNGARQLAGRDVDARGVLAQELGYLWPNGSAAR